MRGWLWTGMPLATMLFLESRSLSISIWTRSRSSAVMVGASLAIEPVSAYWNGIGGLDAVATGEKWPAAAAAGADGSVKFLWAERGLDVAKRSKLGPFARNRGDTVDE